MSGTLLHCDWRVLAMCMVVLAVAPVHAQQDDCGGSAECAAALNALVTGSVQSVAASLPALAKAGISISVDGQSVAGIERPAGSALDEATIDVRFDGLDIERQLSVSTVFERRLAVPGEPVEFRTSWNYGAWIERAEVRLYARSQKSSAFDNAAPLAVLPVGPDGKAIWIAGGEAFGTRDMVHVLRVYDRQGRYDETGPTALFVADTAARFEPVNKSATPGENEKRAVLVNIPLHGGKITVHGRDLPEGAIVEIQGEPAVVDANNAFVAQRILPAGDHQVHVRLRQPGGGEGLEFERQIHIPQSEWFHVGIADLTLGKRFGKESELLTPAAPGEYQSVYNRGRLAFYLKGKVRGSTIITAAMDTREDELDQLFTNLDGKDPRQLLRKLDPDDYYPVYGDDSTTVEDAPTSGKFYLRIDQGRSHVMWGNFKTRIDGVELARYERGLYGAGAQLRSERSTSFGEPVASVTAFGAQPGTLPSRDEMRGTGGSVYFLRRQDISTGSEQIVVEERDPVTGMTLSRATLRPDADYEIDHVQGIVILRRPLASTAPTSSAVQSSSLGGNQYYLVANYEYTPLAFDADGYSYGGRAQAWLSDHLRVGATGFREDTGDADQALFGADFVLRLAERSYFEIEWAQSQGDTFGIVTSSDGGFVFYPVSGAGTGDPAEAIRAKAVLDFADLPGGLIAGNVGAYYEERDAGFNAPGRYTRNDARLWGAFVEFGTRETSQVSGRYDMLDNSNGQSERKGVIEATTRLNRDWSLRAGAQHSDVEGSTRDNGARTDAGVRVTRHFNDTDSAWIFGQATVARNGGRERNDRVGVGAEKALTDKLTASGEVSYGTSGIGLLAGIHYEPTVSDRYYLGYRMSPDTTAGDMERYDPFARDYGALVVGANRKLSDSLSIYSEENLDFLGSQQSLTHGYGLVFTPEPAWKIGASVEAGEIRDETNGDFERLAVAGSLAYAQDQRSAGLKLEARIEDAISGTAQDRDTWLATANWGVAVSRDWRFLAKADAAVSRSDESVVLDGDYIEASAGYAYRPVDNDRLNGLAKYTYLHDLPGPSQVNANDQLAGPRQQSHVFSADFVYDINQRVSLGAKYGVRLGRVNWDRSNDDYAASTAQLGVVRLDVHIVNEWDLMAEGRGLWMSELEQVNYGLLAGVYRQMGDNLKIGFGYNFGRFSDDLTDLTWDDKGVFVNVIGQF